MPSAEGRVEVMTRSYIPDPLATLPFPRALGEVGVPTRRTKPLDPLGSKHQPQPSAAYSLPASSAAGAAGLLTTSPERGRFAGRVKRWGLDPTAQKPSPTKQPRQRTGVLLENPDWTAARIYQIPWAKGRSDWNCPDHGVTLPVHPCLRVSLLISGKSLTYRE